MKEPTITAYDDLILHKTGEKVVAQCEAIFGWNGVWYQADLTSGNFSEIEEFLHPYILASPRMSKPPAPPRGPRNMSMYEERKKFFRGFREWMDEQGRQQDYTTARGGFSPKVSDIKQYEKVTGIKEPKKG